MKELYRWNTREDIPLPSGGRSTVQMALSRTVGENLNRKLVDFLQKMHKRLYMRDNDNNDRVANQLKAEASELQAEVKAYDDLQTAALSNNVRNVQSTRAAEIRQAETFVKLGEELEAAELIPRDKRIVTRIKNNYIATVNGLMSKYFMESVAQQLQAFTGFMRSY